MHERLRVGGRYWLPPLLWTVLVLAFSTASFSGEQTGGVLERVLGLLWPAGLHPRQIEWVHLGIRKLAHFLEYAGLAFLWSRGFARAAGYPAPAAFRKALIASAVTAVIDELHQATCPERTGALADVLLDCMGAVGGGVMYHVWERRRAKCPTSDSLNSSSSW
ncbi:MAG TPA: VanZ family protein [Armatimonadetes bacterium]|nr:VanZ family protein [Armatimonadota bacterium]